MLLGKWVSNAISAAAHFGIADHLESGPKSPKELAALTATQERLVVSVFLSGKYEFSPQEVVAIERYTMIPIMGWGVRIVHSRSDYPQNFIFWNLAGPEPVLRGIREAGFSPSA